MTRIFHTLRQKLFDRNHVNFIKKVVAQKEINVHIHISLKDKSLRLPFFVYFLKIFFRNFVNSIPLATNVV